MEPRPAIVRCPQCRAPLEYPVFRPLKSKERAHTYGGVVLNTKWWAVVGRCPRHGVVTTEA